MPIFGSKDKNGNLACNFMHVNGVSWMSAGAAVTVTLDDSSQQLEIKMRVFKGNPAYLPYSQITSIGVVSEKEVIEHNKSVLGRAAVGGLVFGPLGAIVGGMSGTGTKQKVQNKYFFVINYHPADNIADTKAISLEIVGATLHLEKFTTALRSRIPSASVPVSQYL